MSENDNQDWDFKIKPEEPKKNEETLEQKKPARQKIISKKEKLEIEEAPVYEKTRGELYKQMKAEEDRLSNDAYELANHGIRLVAVLIDYGFIFMITFILKKNLHRFNVDFPEELVLILGAFIAFLIFIVIPTAKINQSIGKKIMGIQVRGEEQFTLNLLKAFQRELMKLILPVSIPGAFLALKDKKRRTFVDKTMETFVIEE